MRRGDNTQSLHLRVINTEETVRSNGMKHRFWKLRKSSPESGRYLILKFFLLAGVLGSSTELVMINPKMSHLHQRYRVIQIIGLENIQTKTTSVEVTCRTNACLDLTIVMPLIPLQVVATELQSNFITNYASMVPVPELLLARDQFLGS